MQILDPSAVLEQLQRLLPKGDSREGESSQASTEEQSSSSRPAQLRTPNDALAALVHATLTRLGFRLTSLSDETQSKTVNTYANNVLPPTWNATGPGSYTFRYAHEQSSLTFLVKIVSLGARVLIHATALESDRTESYEVEVDRFTSRNYWPWPAQQQTSTSHSEPLVNGFVSSSRLSDFLFGFQVKIVQKLVPRLRKEGYEEVSENDQGSSSSMSQQQQQPSRGQQSPPPPGQPWHPDDPDDVYPRAPLRNPLIVGDRDLDPFGARGGSGQPPLFGGGPDNGGGMIVGPNHPMFRDRFQNPSQQGGIGGLGGGIVPPGARFDPVTPFGGIPQPGRPGGGGGIGPFGPGNGRGPRRPPGMGDPDWDEMPPPGNNVSGLWPY